MSHGDEMNSADVIRQIVGHFDDEMNSMHEQLSVLWHATIKHHPIEDAIPYIIQTAMLTGGQIISKYVMGQIGESLAVAFHVLDDHKTESQVVEAIAGAMDIAHSEVMSRIAKQRMGLVGLDEPKNN